MSHYVIAGIVCAICSLPYLTKWFAEAQMERTLKLVDQEVASAERQELTQFQAIANTYTTNGTAKELQEAMEKLEEVMEELQMLEPYEDEDEDEEGEDTVEG